MKVLGDEILQGQCDSICNGHINVFLQETCAIAL